MRSKISIYIYIYIFICSFCVNLLISENIVASSNFTNNLYAEYNLSPKVAKLAFIAYKHAQALDLIHNAKLTIIDFSVSSNKKRLWVIDMTKKNVLMHTWVSHGNKSGFLYATKFSNQKRSHESSIGVMLTDKLYTGKHGLSLRIKGLEHNFNNNVFSRSIVFHGSQYVTSNFIVNHHYAGRSWGCFAVSTKYIKNLVKTIKGKSLVFAYYPDSHWLHDSEYLKIA